MYPPSEQRVKAIDAFIELPNGMDSNISSSSSDNDSDDYENNRISIDSIHEGLRSGMKNLYSGDDNIELDAIIVASGGFAMDDDNYDISTASTNGMVYEKMFQMNYYPVVAAGEIAKEYLTPTNDGLFLTIGAVSALSPSPGMIAYSSSKAASHYYVQTLGAMTGRALRREHKISRESELGNDLRRKHPCLDCMTAVSMLPIMLDTDSNRDALPKDDFSQWTKPMDIAEEIGLWIDNPVVRPHSGSLIKVLTKDGETQFVLAR